MARVVVAQLWTGALPVKRLGPADADPTPEELDALAVAYLPWNDGVKPNVRVLEEMPFRNRLGAAGTVPR